MLGLPVRYLLQHTSELAADPVDTWTRLHEMYLDGREQSAPSSAYEADADWERRLHDVLGLKWPCESAPEFWDLWARVINELEMLGIRPGPESFQFWNDGDAGFVRTIWCLIRHLKLSEIVETGVAHGVTSRFILEALEKNGSGHLWSIDLPPLDRAWKEQVGIAVGDRFAGRWTYIKGTSRRRLPELLSELGQVALFVHDSSHTGRNVRFEMTAAWAALRAGSALIVDDVDVSDGFRAFTQSRSGHQALMCEAEPIHPDLRRFNEKGLFGVVLKEPISILTPV
jgi:Methyltransferase domain